MEGDSDKHDLVRNAHVQPEILRELNSGSIFIFSFSDLICFIFPLILTDLFPYGETDMDLERFLEYHGNSEVFAEMGNIKILSWVREK